MSPKNLLSKYPVLRSFLKNLEPEKIEAISKIIVYGSIATGLATSQSDIDIIVLLTSESVAAKDIVRKAAYKAMEENSFARLISVHFMEESRFAELLNAGYSFETEIESEGVPLWKAA